MPIIYQVTKAKAPFRTGIFQVPSTPVIEPESVKPVESEVVEKPVENIPEVVEPVVEEIKEEVVESPKLSDCSEFSEGSIKNLTLNNIITVQDLKDYMANNNNDLTPLAKIGKKNAAVILEELGKWEANQQ